MFSLFFFYQEERARLNVTGKRGDSHTLEATWSKEDLFKLDLVIIIIFTLFKVLLDKRKRSLKYSMTLFCQSRFPFKDLHFTFLNLHFKLKFTSSKLYGSQITQNNLSIKLKLDC